MSKFNYSTLANLQNETTAVTTINNNFEALKTLLDSFLSRDGVAPNPMTSSLDMNSNRIINLPAATTNTEPVRYAEFLTAILNAAAIASLTSRSRLLADTTYYVKMNGSDSNSGLANTSTGAFLTIQAAINAVLAIDLNGFNVTIQVGAGTYAAGFTLAYPWVGKGTVTLIGDATTPANVIISTTSASCMVVTGSGSVISVSGFKLKTTTSGHGINVSQGGRLLVTGKMDFNTCAQDHFKLGQFGWVNIAVNWNITGAAGNHINIANNSIFAISGALTVTLTGTPAFTGSFISASKASTTNTAGLTFSGSATTPTNRRAVLSSGSTIDAGGLGTAYFPGTGGITQDSTSTYL